MKMTMHTPGRNITIELPAWIERRILQMFMTEAKRGEATPHPSNTEQETE